MLDVPATDAERARRADAPAADAAPAHALGPERERWERVFPAALADRLEASLRTLPVTTRAPRRREVVGGVLAGLPPRFPGVPATDEEIAAAGRAFAAAVTAAAGPA